MAKMLFRAAILFLVSFWAAVPSALADTVFLQNGSEIVGEIESVSEGILTVTTDFAGRLEIDIAQVRGLSSERKVVVDLSTGDRAVGTLVYSEPGGQKIQSPMLGEISLRTDQIVALRSAPEGPVKTATEEVAALEEEMAQQETEYERELEELRQFARDRRDPWSGEIGAGVNGQAGNTDRVALHSRGQVIRETEVDRLRIYARNVFAEEEDRRAANEVLGGLDLEVDVNEDLFAFGSLFLEFDEFENLDLRARPTAGLGYFLVRTDLTKFKIRVGAGYQHETFDTGATTDQALMEFGYDWEQLTDVWLRLTHSLTYFPTFEGTSDFRLVADTALKIPISEDKLWNIRVGVRNEFDNTPQPGNEELDTIYLIDFLREFR